MDSPLDRPACAVSRRSACRRLRRSSNSPSHPCIPACSGHHPPHAVGRASTHIPPAGGAHRPHTHGRVMVSTSSPQKKEKRTVFWLIYGTCPCIASEIGTTSNFPTPRSRGSPTEEEVHVGLGQLCHTATPPECLAMSMAEDRDAGSRTKMRRSGGRRQRKGSRSRRRRRCRHARRRSGDEHGRE